MILNFEPTFQWDILPRKDLAAGRPMLMSSEFNLVVSYRAKDFSADPKAVEDVKQHGQEMVFMVSCVVVVVVVVVVVAVAVAVAGDADAAIGCFGADIAIWFGRKALLVEAPAVGDWRWCRYSTVQ